MCQTLGESFTYIISLNPFTTVPRELLLSPFYRRGTCSPGSPEEQVRSATQVSLPLKATYLPLAMALGTAACGQILPTWFVYLPSLSHYKGRVQHLFRLLQQTLHGPKYLPSGPLQKTMTDLWPAIAEREGLRYRTAWGQNQHPDLTVCDQNQRRAT